MKIGNTYFKVYDLVLMGLSFLILLVLTIWLATRWGSLPDTIPTHYDFFGNVDATGAKTNLFILPVLGWVIWITFTVLDFFPGAWNIPGASLGQSTSRHSTHEGPQSALGKAQAISITRTFLEVIKLLVVLLFTYLTVIQANGQTPGAWLVAVVIVLLAGTVIANVLLVRRLK